MLLALAVGFTVHNHLMLTIDRRHRGVTLDHAMTGLHLGALRIGDVALADRAFRSAVLVVGGEEFLDLAHIRAQACEGFLFPIARGSLGLGGIGLTRSEERRVG